MATEPIQAGLTNVEQANFSSFDINFPKTPDLNMDMGLVGAELIQSVEEHDRLILQFKGKPADAATTIVEGDPVIFTYKSFKVLNKFCGYVTKIEQNNTPQVSNTIVHCISVSYVLKQTDQKIYTNITADQVVQKTAEKHGMQTNTQRHARVRPSIVQAGQSDWQLLRRLAKQTGFALRAENMTVTFMSKSKIFESKKTSAPYFNYIDSTELGTTTKPERMMGSVVYFYPHISDHSPELGSRVDRVISGIHEKTGEVIKTVHPPKDFSIDTKGIVIPSEEYFQQ